MRFRGFALAGAVNVVVSLVPEFAVRVFARRKRQVERERSARRWLARPRCCGGSDTTRSLRAWVFAVVFYWHFLRWARVCVYFLRVGCETLCDTACVAVCSGRTHSYVCVCVCACVCVCHFVCALVTRFCDGVLWHFFAVCVRVCVEEEWL